MSGIASGLKNLDFYPKILEDFKERTYVGAAITIISSIIIFWLILTEVSIYMSTDVTNELVVDSMRDDFLRINIDMTFPKLPCNFLSLDVLDIAGETQLNVASNIYKRRLNPDGSIMTDAQIERVVERAIEEVNSDQLPVPQNGNGCASCYGAESDLVQCCETCDSVREAYRQKGWAFTSSNAVAQCVNEGFEKKMEFQKDEGCELYGYLNVQKVAGNFHIAPGVSYQSHHMHVHDTDSINFGTFNLTHSIKKLSFGYQFPGVVQPLDGVKKISDHELHSMMYQYYIKVVPTTYTSLSGETIESNQFSVTEYSKPADVNDHSGSTSHTLPGVYFIYDFSPIRVNYIEHNIYSLSQLLTNLCAIIGGVFTISTIFDSLLYHGINSIKRNLGKDH
eukprot:TRINITY_DN1300_c0_g2_i1.p1 TRINITY_DN1300_c0_g2~~TRINITY_DN1300_c0_g2_i1.p1  ORF type:complete len:393 (+),score=109.92 TRINITY_DN1300_c0_g2_i1:46-1224(+)